jgi:hypothetical protein
MFDREFFMSRQNYQKKSDAQIGHVNTFIILQTLGGDRQNLEFVWKVPQDFKFQNLEPGVCRQIFSTMKIVEQNVPFSILT